MLADKELWSFGLHQRPSSRSILTSTHILAPDRETSLTHLDPATGDTRWTVPIRNPWGWLATACDRVFYLDQRSRVQCHDLATGGCQWTRQLDGIGGWLVAGADLILSGGWRGYTPLVCLDARDGAVRWTHQLGKIAEPILGPWGIAVASLESPTLQFLDPQTGSITSTQPLPAHGQDPDATPLLRAHGDQLYLASSDGEYCRIGPQHTTRLFHHPAGIHTIAPMIFDDTILFMDRAATLQAYALDGTPRWSVPWRLQRRDLLPSARSSHGHLAVADGNGHVSVFDADGNKLWSKHLTKRIETPLAWYDDTTLLTGTANAIVAIRLQRRHP